MLLHRKSKDLKEPLIINDKNDNWEKKQLLDDLDNIEENHDGVNEQEEEWGLYVANSEPRLKYSIEYGKEIGFSRALAVGVYVFFILASPWVFRYAVASDNAKIPNTPARGPIGNATVSMNTAWTSCNECNNFDGVTVDSLLITITNVTYPSLRSGIPSLAIFASKDSVNWFNFYSPPSRQQPYISDWYYSQFNLTQENGIACLGDVYSTYIVACLNVKNLASTYSLGETIEGPPFNDRCFMLQGICGVPCVRTIDEVSPPNCFQGYMNQSDLFAKIASENSDTGYIDEWGFGKNNLPLWMRAIDWIVIMTIFFDTFSNILRFLPLLCGGPSEIQAAKSINLHGSAILGNGTPIVSESEALFLRGLVGRTATALHTVASRHNIQGIYVDTIINEKAEKKGARLRMWVAWIRFITLLASKNPNELGWVDGEIGDYSNSGELIKKDEGDNKEAKAYKVLRHLRLKREQGDIYYDASITSVKFEKPSLGTPKGVEFSETDNGHARPSFSRTKSSESSRKVYTMEQLVPMTCFLDGWLEEIKSKDAIYNYMSVDPNDKEALRNIINDAPIHKYFSGEHFQKVQEELQTLYHEFNCESADVFEVPNDAELSFTHKKSPDHCISDECVESLWRVQREDMNEWSIAWTYWRRARLVKPEKKLDDGVIYESTRIKEGTIVFKKQQYDISDDGLLEKWLDDRSETYKVVNIDSNKLKLEPYPPKDTGGDNPIHDETDIVNVELIEKNRGKAGALNVFIDYLRYRGKKWTSNSRIYHFVPIYVGIMDARHMIAEPHIFWNEALPFFIAGRKGKKELKKSRVILVQYPQFFSNVSDDDYLDNKNAGYYTVWQTLRDCAKCVTSSGTNAIWDVTVDDAFQIATTSRIEDTATTQQYFSNHLTIHLPCYVAFGIAKNTGDYIEAVYRWSTGAVELWYATVFSRQITDFLIIGAMAASYFLASFSESIPIILVWFGPVVFLLLFGYYEKSSGSKPLRQLNVSATIVLNTMYWISNLSSLVWVLLVPGCIAILGFCPISYSPIQALTWAGVSIVLRIPPALMTNSVISMVKHLFKPVILAHESNNSKSHIQNRNSGSSEETKNDSKEGRKKLKTDGRAALATTKTTVPERDKTNFSMVLWRSSQLYICSFNYALLSVVSGTYTAFRARFFDTDNTLWASFKKPIASKKKEALNVFLAAPCSCKGWGGLYQYCNLQIQSFLVDLVSPDFLTKWLAAFLLIFQIACLSYSIGWENRSNAPLLLISIAICFLNVFLVVDIALLLMPSIGEILGTPIRPEYAFAFLSIVVLTSSIVNQTLDLTFFVALFTPK